MTSRVCNMPSQILCKAPLTLYSKRALARFISLLNSKRGSVSRELALVLSLRFILTAERAINLRRGKYVCKGDFPVLR